MKLILAVFTVILFTLPSFARQSEWTYAFYLASGKGLYREQNKNFLEICKGAEQVRNGRVIAFIDVEPEKRKISSLRLGRGSYVFEVKSCADMKRIFIPAVGLTEGANIDSENPQVIQGFFDYVRKNYSSQNYFYDVAAHGDTVLNPNRNAFSPDNMAKIFSHNKPDILALDMCYSGSIEGLWAMNSSGKLIIAASTTVPLSLNNYRTFLEKAGVKNASPAAAAKDFINAYRETYAKKRYPISIFAFETGKRFEDFIKAFNSRTAAFAKEAGRFEKIKAGKSAKSNLYGTNTDFFNVIKTIDGTLAVKLEPAVISSFSINTAFSGPSLFLPVNAKTYEKHRIEFMKTKFAKDVPGWPAFLDILYNHK